MLLRDQEQVAQVAREIAYLDPQDRIAIDTETTGLLLDNGDVLRGISYALPSGHAGYLPVSHPDLTLNPAPLIRALQCTQARHLYWNAPFDILALSQVGMSVPTQYDDAMVLSWSIDENVSHRLKDQGVYYFGGDAKEEQTALKKIMAGRKTSEIYKELRGDGWSVAEAKEEAATLVQASKKTFGTIGAEDIAPYAEKDTTLTMSIWERQHQGHYENTDPFLDYARAIKVQECVYRMTRLGVQVDLETVSRQRENNLRIMSEIEPTFEGVNLRSTKQLAQLIYGKWGVPVQHRTKMGNPSTAREALEEIEEAHGGVAAIIEYRKRAKAVGTYYDAFLAKADDKGRVHTNLNTTGTVTGRFSSSQPNLQNIPREETDPEVKAVFIAEEGYELWEYDIKSAELFIGAAIAGDVDMLGALSEEGRDFHSETALKIFGSIEGNRRTLAKAMNYAIPYGIGSKKYARYLVKGTGRPVTDSDIKKARNILARWKQAWPVTNRAIKLLERFADRNHYLPLQQPGRYRHFRGPGIWVPSYTAYNAAVQGGVAEHMKSVMLAVEDPIKSLGARMVLQVHDSFWIEQPPGVVPGVWTILQDASDQVNLYPLTRLLFDAKRRYPKEST